MNFFNRWKNDQEGFSLVELIIVLVLIVIIVVVIINVRGCGKDGEAAARALTTFGETLGLI